MEWLLKIVEGPMRGAEIALPNGVAVTFGSGEDCDVVVMDSSVPTQACSIKADEGGVTFVPVGGEAIHLPAFEMRSFGTTTFAVGPASGEWEALTREVIETKPEEPLPASDEPSDAEVAETAGGDSDPADAGRRRWVAWLAAIVLFLIVVLLLLWFLRVPVAGALREHGVALPAWVLRQLPEGASGASSDVGGQVMSKPTLADLAGTYALTLSPGPRPLLSGNMRRRTERLAVRALALAADPSVRLDLTDDETLLASAGALLAACTDGAMRALAASNRTVTVAGYAPSVAAFERTVRALNADVPGIARLDTTRVQVGGPAPSGVDNAPTRREADSVAASSVPVSNPTLKKPTVRDYPVAGILTVPYPCVVMRNGMRLVEGAQIGKAVLTKISADRLTLKEGGKLVEWMP